MLKATAIIAIKYSYADIALTYFEERNSCSGPLLAGFSLGTGGIIDLVLQSRVPFNSPYRFESGSLVLISILMDFQERNSSSDISKITL